MPTARITLYKGKSLTNDAYPVMLIITHNSKSFRIRTGYRTEEKKWDSRAREFKRNMENHKVKNAVLRELLLKARNVFDEIRRTDKAFSPQLFKDLFTGNKKQMTVYDYMQVLIDNFKDRGQVNTAHGYVVLRNQLFKFYGKRKVLLFSDVDVRLLNKFETYLIKRGCSGGGISHYMRTIRSTYNKAIDDEYAEEKYYPFSTNRKRKGYMISKLKSTASPRALSLSDMEKYKGFDFDEHQMLKDSYLIFLFSYYSRGMNFVDMSYLKKTDIVNGRLRYFRQKTGGKFNIPISENLQKILNEFSDVDTEYVFPVLSDFHKSPAQQKNRIKKCLKKVNGDLKEIGELLRLEIKLTSYVARHTYATTLKRKKANIGFISQAMGHTDINTTKAYLENFENDEIDKLDDLL